jgi:hypothetical protein
MGLLTGRYRPGSQEHGVDLGPLDVSYLPPALTRLDLRRRRPDDRAAEG